jgi:hypothetical protein
VDGSIDALVAGSAIFGDRDDRLRTNLNQGEGEIELAEQSALQGSQLCKSG